MTIGPKCQLCRKPLKYHGAVHRLCPAGKRRKCPVTGEILYEESHPTDTFQAKPPPKPRGERIKGKAKRGGSEKRKDRTVRRSVKANPCCACGTVGSELNPVDPAHIRSWKVSQCDSSWNILSFCRHHHQQQEARGWFFMMCEYKGVHKALAERGWGFETNESTGDWSMFNEKEVALNLARRGV